MFLCDSRGIKGLEKLQFSQNLSGYWDQGPGGALSATLLPGNRVVEPVWGWWGCDDHAAFRGWWRKPKVWQCQGRAALSAESAWWKLGTLGPAEGPGVPFRLAVRTGGSCLSATPGWASSPYLTHIPCQSLLSPGHLICPSQRPPGLLPTGDYLVAWLPLP